MTEDDLSYEPPPVLLPCSICNRTFRPDVLDRHTKVCEKTASKKRRVFDSFKSRVSGTELEEFLGPAPLPGQAPKRPDKSPPKKNRGTPKWKETHENLIAVLRAARGVASADPAAVFASKNSGNEQCPSCGRFFGPRAFDRHVQFCKEKTSRIKITPSKVSQAQERLEARTKYKAPLSLKPKLTTKEKYSPMLPRKVESSEACSVSSSSKSSSINLINKTVKPAPAKSNLSNFTRQSPSRSSERQRSCSPRKSLVSSSSKLTKEPQGKFPMQPKIKDNLRSTEDFRPRTGAKASAPQDKLRKFNRKMCDIEDESPKSNRKYRVKSVRKSCLSSDDGNETDSLNSTTGSTGTSEKDDNKKVTIPRSPARKGVSKGKLTPSPGRGREDGESKSSRRIKVRLPVINDLSVNDESFGIHVAPCPQRVQQRRKSSAGQKKLRSQFTTSDVKGAMVETEENGKGNDSETNCEIRSSKIPKPVVKGPGTLEEGLPRVEGINDDDNLKKGRGRTAVIKKDKMKKWCDLSKVTTKELLHMSDEFDFISELDDLQTKETGDCEIDAVSHSTVWGMMGEDWSKSDESMECKADGLDPSPAETKEDEFIVLHIAEPEKMNDNDFLIKMSVSEPCFKSNYVDPNLTFKIANASPNVFIFDSPAKRFRRKAATRKTNKSSWSKKAKTAPKTLKIRERTFLASDSPLVKRRKVSEKEESPHKPKIINISDYFFGTIENIPNEKKKLDTSPGKCREKGITRTSKDDITKKKNKNFVYFEIGKDDIKREISLKEMKNEDGEKIVEVHETTKNKLKKNKKINEKKENRARVEERAKKCTIYYSDEEFEELRQKKEKSLRELNKKILDTTLLVPELSCEEESKTIRSDSDDSKSVELSQIDSLEIGSLKIAEEEEPTERSIQIEDFIIKKPDKLSIMSKNGNCLEELFPKPPAMTALKGRQSSTVISLSYELDSLYDLKGGENLLGRSVRGQKEGGTKLPAISNADNRKKDNKGKSVCSLVQIWKARREKTGNGESSFRTEMEKKKPKNLIQIALLPLVLTQKLAEVAQELDGSKSKDDKYDPFKQAERQMMTLLSWPSTVDLKTTNEKDQTLKSVKSFQANTTANLETSPTSAFSKYNSRGEDDPSPKEMKENVNQKKVQNSAGRTGKRSSAEYSPMYSAADDWEQIFEKHFDLNRNEMNENMTRSVKSALDGLSRKNAHNSYSSSPERENSPPRKNRSELSESSIIDEISYTSTPKRPGSRMSNVGDDRKTPVYSNRKTSGHGKITPPDDFSDSIVPSDRSGRKSNRNSGVSLSSLSFCSQASDTTLADEEIMRANLEIIGVGKSPSRTSRRKFARSQSVFDERNKMLFAKAFDTHFSSSDENDMLPTISDQFSGRKTSTNNPYPKSVPSRFPRSQSVMDGRSKYEGDHLVERDEISSPEGGKSRKAKMSGDSAYSSLNRRSPRVQANQQEDRLSSSGSEHSLPRLGHDHPLKPVSLNFDNTKKEQPGYKMSKFCHECGSKYPVAVAKFCCECGVRRLII